MDLSQLHIGNSIAAEGWECLLPNSLPSPKIMSQKLFLQVFCLSVLLSGCTRSDSQGIPSESNNYGMIDKASQGEDLDLFSVSALGLAYETPPKISQTQVIDLDQDGQPDILVCDCEMNLVSWIHQSNQGVWEEDVLMRDLAAPARAECVDMDQDGDMDLVVALLGVLYPNNDKLGSVELLLNDSAQEFTRSTLLDDVARVADVRAADFNQDGLLDLAVTHFGYHQGEFRWMENLGELKFESHVLQELAGGIHGIPTDLNADGNQDIVVLISQDTEEIHCHLGDGKGNFSSQRLYKAPTTEFGSSGIWIVDLDQDDDPDIVYTNGDSFDYSPPHPWPWHGVQWFENQGNMTFKHRRITSFGGAVAAHVVDYDKDGDLDIFVASTFNDWENPHSDSLLWLENIGKTQFVRHGVASNPTHLQSIDSIDVDGDGVLELITGGMHVCEPYDRVQRVAVWRSRDTQNRPTEPTE